MSWSSNLDLLRRSGEEVRIVRTGKGLEVRILDSSGNPVTALPLSSARAALCLCESWGLKVAKE